MIKTTFPPIHRGAIVDEDPEQPPTQHLPELASRGDTHQREPPSAAPSLWDKGETLLGAWDIVGCRRGAACDCTRLLVGCLGEEPKVGKGRDQGRLGINKL